MFVRVEIRAAGPGDVPWCVAQLRAFASEYPSAHPIMGDDTHAEAMMGDLIRGQCVRLATLPDGTPVGLIAGMVAPHPFNPGLRLASELFWFVAPEYRGSRAGFLLLLAFDAWATENGAHAVHMALEAGSPVNDRFLTKRGYRKAEVHYLRDLVGMVSAAVLMLFSLTGCGPERMTGPEWTRVEAVCTLTAQADGTLVDRCEGAVP